MGSAALPDVATRAAARTGLRSTSSGAAARSAAEMTERYFPDDGIIPETDDA